MRSLGFLNLLLLAISRYVLGLPQNLQIHGRADNSGGVVSREFWWMQGAPINDKLDVDDKCSYGLHCLDIELCNLYNGSIKADVEQYYDPRQYFEYDTGNVIFWFKKCDGVGKSEKVCCKTKIVSQQFQDPGLHSISVGAQCAKNQACVPYFQCNNGVINTIGTGIIDLRTDINTTCMNPKYPDESSVCCDIPDAEKFSVSTDVPLDSDPTSLVVGNDIAPMSHTADPNAECATNQACVPDFQCNNGVINTIGVGIMDLRTDLILSCNNPKYPDESSICCDIPDQAEFSVSTNAPLEGFTIINVPTSVAVGNHTTPTCDGDKVCVIQELCDASENVIADGSDLIDLRIDGGLIDFHINHKRCYVDGTEFGVCCTPPGSSMLTTPGPSVNTSFGPPEDITGIILSTDGSSGNLTSKTCDGHKICVSQGLCIASGDIIKDGAGLMDLRIDIVHEECYVDGSSEVGVCCSPP